jgi:PadR family transcriptional regulator AphA
MKDLTTTSYALLGLLALRPWTTYELAQQMERSLRNFWPRAQSKLYEEPKNLVAHGLATAKRERVGKRPRTVYAITPKGREALRAWLDVPGAPMMLESEALLKVFFADQGTKEQLLAQIRNIKAWAEQERERGMTFIREYAETGGPFPERLNIIGLMVGFLARRGDAVLDWARWAEE